MKKVLIFLGSVTTLNLSVAQNQTMTGGLKVPTPEGLNTIFLSVPKAGAAFDVNSALPSAVDLSEYLPKPGNQSQQASCSAWAVGYGLKGFYRATKGKYKPTELPAGDIERMINSPAFIYNQVHPKAEDCNSGIYLKDALAFLQNNGIASWSDMPYKGDDCKSDPKPDVIDKAKANRIANFTPIYYLGDPRISTFVDLEAFRRQLANGYPDITKAIPIVVGVHLDSRAINKDFDLVTYNGKTIKMWSLFLGGTVFNSSSYHAMLCVGYDKNLKAFKFLNSWGDDQGGGFLWLSDQVVDRAVKEAYVTEDLVDSRRIDDRDKIRNMNTIDKPTSSSSTSTSLSASTINTNIFGSEQIASINENPMAYEKNIDTTIVAESNIPALAKNNFIVTSWFKKGYYRDFGSYRIGLSDITEERCCILIRFTDLIAEKEIAKFTASLDSPVIFSYNNQSFSFLFTKLAKDGLNPFKSKKAFFRFSRSFIPKKGSYINN